MKRQLLWMAVVIGIGLLMLPSNATAKASWFHVDDAEDYTLRLEPRVWLSNESTLDGSFEFETDLGLQAVAGLDASLNKEKRFNPFVELQFSERHKLRGAYLKIAQGATLTGNNFSIVEGGTPIDQSRVETASAMGNIELTMFEIGYQYDLFQGSWGYIGPLIDIATVDFDLLGAATYDSTGDGVIDQDDREQIDGVAPLPQLGIGFRWYPIQQRIALRGEVKGITIGSRGTFLQAFGGIEFQASQHFGINGGYQYLRLDVDIDAVNASFENHGPFLGAVLRF